MSFNINTTNRFAAFADPKPQAAKPAPAASAPKPAQPSAKKAETKTEGNKTRGANSGARGGKRGESSRRGGETRRGDGESRRGDSTRRGGESRRGDGESRRGDGESRRGGDSRRTDSDSRRGRGESRRGAEGAVRGPRRGNDETRGDQVKRTERPEGLLGDNNVELKRRDDRGEKKPHRGGPRKYDRHSGTGRPINEEKKKSHGKGNWGDVSDEVAAVNEAEQVATEGGEQVPATPEREPEPEEKKLSLAEYLNKQAAEQFTGGELPAKRVVAEDETLKEKYVKLDKKAPVKDSKPAEKKNKAPVKDSKPAEKNEKKKAKKTVLPLNQVFAPSAFKSDTRPQRDNNKPQRGGKRGKGENFNFAEESFPSLSA